LRFQSQPEVLTADTFGGQFAPPQYFSRWQATDFFHTESLSVTMLPNTALEPTAAAPLFCILMQIHACGFSRRGSAFVR
jgi:hypothetical protein